jgi:hypothetical protein
MKQITLIYILLLCISISSFAQETVQATIKPTAGVSNGVSIFLKSNVAFSEKVLSFLVTIAIPTSVGTKPVLTVNNSPNTSITYLVQTQVNQSIQGVMHYIYAVGGTGDVGAAGIVFSAAANTEIEAVRFIFSGNSVSTSQIKMVNLPDGGLGDDGAGSNANGYFGFSLALSGDRVNNGAMFYAVPTVSSAQNNISGTGISGLSITTTVNNVALPVKFTSFSATKKDNDALLSWVVENETSLVTNYEVERSIDGIKFDKINTIATNAAGTSSIYNITDPNLSAIKNNGIIYYRIKQTDINGEFVYSDIRNVRILDKGTLISVFPNPVNEFTIVKIDATEATDATLALINADGKQIQTTTLRAVKGLNFKKIETNNLPKGDYLLKVTLGVEVQTIKVIKL